MTQARNLPAGTQLGPYEILDLLGEGSSGAVYRVVARDGVELAAKVRATSTEASDRRFLREFESLRTIRVPGVVQVHEAGLDGDMIWFSMDLVQGGPFVAHVREQSGWEEQIARTIHLGRQLLDILDALHQSDFIHRDIKPSNVLVDSDGRVKLLDFGIARFFAERETTRSTQHRHLLGTLPYMAPEQLAALPLTPAADLFATAIMLHEALAGPRARPRNAFGWIAKTCMESLPPLATLYKEVPLGLSKLIERMLDIDPHRRPPTREAARTLRMLEAGTDFPVWPLPAFADPGPWWEPIESAVTGDGPRAWVLEGPSGSGRSTLAAQLKRMGAMQGTWSIEITCRVDAVGGPVEAMLDAILRPTRHEPWSHRLMRPHAALLRRVWPTLPLSGSGIHNEAPELSQVAEVVGDLVLAMAQKQPLLLVVRQAERVDRLTSAVLSSLARRTGPGFGMVILHDRRWQTWLSEGLIASIERSGGGVLQMRATSREASLKIAASLCPSATPKPVQGPPLRAVEAGLAQLAQWRRVPFTPPASAPWALAVRDTPLPTEVLVKLCGRAALENPWAREGEYGWMLESEMARQSVQSGIENLADAARRMADAWERSGLNADDETASLRILAGTPKLAWSHALAAAKRGVARGRYGEARRWLQLIEGLGAPSSSDAFSLASLQAEVAQVTDPGAAPSQLLTRAESLATKPSEVEWCQLLRAELSLGERQTKSALVAALRLGSPREGLSKDLAARALQLAAQARITLGSIPDADRELQRAKAHLSSHSHRDLRVRQGNASADLALASGDLLEARRRSRHTLRLASEAGHLGGAAACSARMGQLLRRLGRRRQAEDYARAAREAYQESGDHRRHAAATLALATLVAERCDAAVARPLLDQAVRRIRGLHLTHLLPAAMILSLELATLQANTAEATISLAALDIEANEEAPAAMVRWWRSRGEPHRALDVPPPKSTWGLALFHLQRALAQLGAGQDGTEDAERAQALAQGAGFSEIALHAELLLAADADAVVWAPLRDKARQSLHVELHLGVMALDGRRLTRAGKMDAARQKWETLRARARQLGYRPAVEEAEGWLEVAS